ncbi:hypothetical protein BD779DRAFT_1676213 [Infundibulicybe gibba]|nr:hypothetical protein BD779DRAFT_1676213 [Infundibulicybe gibba]
MFSKAFSLYALVLAGIAGVAAQLEPGLYIIRSAALDLDTFPLARVRDSGSGQPLIVSASSSVPQSELWSLTFGTGGGLIMQNVAFETFLKVTSNNPGTTVATDTDETQATSFAITSAGSGLSHINVVGQDLLWTLPAATEATDLVIHTEWADGRQEQLWKLNRL